MKISTFLYISLLSLLALLPAKVCAQAYLMPTTGTASYTTCAGTLYDDGGPNDSYDTNASGSLTLRPGTVGAKLKLEFTMLEIDSINTRVYVYDGPDTNSPMIDAFAKGRPTVYATGSTGALTVVMYAFGYPRRGFAATISCFTGAPPVPELAVTNLMLVPAVVPAGDYTVPGAQVSNLAGGRAAYQMRYLLSADTTLDASDTELAMDKYTMAAGNQYTVGQWLTMPSSTAPGKYYVLAVAQLLGDTETNTTNNLAYAPLTIAPPTTIPDLAITNLGFYSGPQVLGPGSTLYTSVRQQNFGNTLAQRAAIGYYFSTDAVLSADDQLLASATGEMPTTGKSSSISKPVVLPASIVPGSYYLLCVADHLDQVIEANEQNNTYAYPLTVPPPHVDVTFGRNISALPSQVGAGGNLSVYYSLQNDGNAVLDSATVGYYLSADRNLSADDVLLHYSAIGPVLPGSFMGRNVTSTFGVPASTPPGKRYLLLVADYRQELAETNEANNLIALALDVVTPNVDLAITGVRNGSSYSPAVGTVFYTRCTLANRGTTMAYPSTLGYYLSTDNQLSADDILLNQPQSMLLQGGASQVIDGSPTLPANVAPGAYYLLFVADYNKELTETDETNNVAALAIEVAMPLIDLTLDYNFGVQPARTPAGTDIKVSYYFRNLGATPVYEPAVGFYLSTDNVLSSNDIFIGSYQLRYNSLFPSYYSSLTTSVTVPRNTAPGSYYVLGVADYQDLFAETDETNNVRYAPLEITAPRPNLTLSENPYLAAQQVVAGNHIATESYVNNIGAGAATASRVGYFLSTDPYYDSGDVLMGSTVTTAVQPGYSALVTGTLSVPATTAGGRYYVLFVADYLNQLDDLDPSNNTRYTTLTVNPLPLATREQTAGYQLQVSPVPVAQATPLRVQFSGPGARAEAVLTLYNSIGQTVFTRSLALVPGQRNQAELPTTGLPAGVYVLQLTGPSLNAVRRVVVE